MNAQQCLTYLVEGIHSTVAATVDEQGLPHTCAIDMMLADEGGLYFLTARGKAFYRRLMARRYLALSGMKGEDTLSTVAVSVRGWVKPIGQQRLEEILEKNPYMREIYPTEASRRALEVFCLYRGEGEYFDLSQLPPFRQTFSFGGEGARASAYQIDPARCIGCQACREVCPTGCISGESPRAIDPAHCIHCGNCADACPVGAVERPS
ncbi:4Fe-4S binding protein [Bittarella massiliensis (ex Durand et al. 2017)]|uniref:4Fe-4S binding protein n=1 Tax=Bittarella massiliensis (ex Durand et al. 2017) TaxID=1720313 RepID=A0AAW5KGD0_9FIRM|nr:4Fe-4S binding protein [Bittarella massiliensis (ex Durand et al. 2017)]